MSISPETETAFKTIFAILVLVNFAGNTLVCLIVRRFVFMKTPMNYLLVHLAICDMLTGLFFLCRRVLYGLYQFPGGVSGNFLCVFFSMAWLVSVTGVYTLIVVALERYSAITKPLAPRLSNKKFKISIAICWLVGILVWIPTGITNHYSSKIKGCESSWNVSWGPTFDCMIWLIIVGIIPSFIMVLLYGRVIRILWFSKNRVDDISQRSLMRSRKKVTKAAITITVLLFVCWMPNLIYYVIVTFVSQDAKDTHEDLNKASPIFYPVSLVLILFNSSINPFIYALQDIRYIKCIRSLLCGRCIRERKTKERQKTNTDTKEGGSGIQMKVVNNGMA